MAESTQEDEAKTKADGAIDTLGCVADGCMAADGCASCLSVVVGVFGSIVWLGVHATQYLIHHV